MIFSYKTGLYTPSNNTDDPSNKTQNGDIQLVDISNKRQSNEDMQQQPEDNANLLHSDTNGTVNSAQTVNPNVENQRQEMEGKITIVKSDNKLHTL